MTALATLPRPSAGHDYHLEPPAYGGALTRVALFAAEEACRRIGAP